MVVKGDAVTGAAIDSPGTEGAGDTTPVDHAAQVEQTLLQARALIESTVSLHRRRPDPGPAAAHTDVAVLGEAVADLVLGARHSVCLAITGKDAFGRIARESLAMLDSGPVVRLLCAPEVADGSLCQLTRTPGARFEVRVSEAELRDIVVVDGAAALVRAAAGNAKGQATQVNDPAACEPLNSSSPAPGPGAASSTTTWRSAPGCAANSPAGSWSGCGTATRTTPPHAT